MRSNRLIKTLGLFVFLLSAITACSFRKTPDEATTTLEEPSQVFKSEINLPTRLELSQKPEDLALAKRLDEIISQSDFSSARWGIFVVSLKDGRILVARDADKAFIPASVMKIFTSVVALDKLGKDFRWKTLLLAKGEIKNHVLNGDLILYGQGAPDLDDAGIRKLVEKLKERGIRRVKGDIIGDDSFFRGDSLGDGWTWNEIQWYYGAEASALSVNLNQTRIALENGKLVFDDVVKARSDVLVSTSADLDSIGVKRELGENYFYVWGEGKNLNVRVAVQNPALWAAKILRDEMKKSGIVVEGSVRAVDWKSKDKTDVQKVEQLASVESATLGDIIRQMNKHSINLYAELILRTLGRRFGETTPEEDPKLRKVRGDDRAGIEVIKKWLSEKGIVLKQNEAIHDGSGLSRLNLITPEAVGRVLIAAMTIADSKAFLDSLPVAGKDGTLSGRLTQFSDKIIAKTGSISSVTSLAGYIKRSDETLAFVIFCNNTPNNASELIDKLASEIVVQ